MWAEGRRGTPVVEPLFHVVHARDRMLSILDAVFVGTVGPLDRQPEPQPSGSRRYLQGRGGFRA